MVVLGLGFAADCAVFDGKTPSPEKPLGKFPPKSDAFGHGIRTSCNAAIEADEKDHATVEDHGFTDFAEIVLHQSDVRRPDGGGAADGSHGEATAGHHKRRQVDHPIPDHAHVWGFDHEFAATSVVVTSVVMATVIASAGVFRMLTRRTVAEVEGEFLDHRFGIRLGFDLDDDRKHVAFGECLVGDQ